MKTFRMIGMALFTVLICINLASCSSSDDDEPETNEEGIVTNEKKLIEMNINKGKTIFIYDNKGRLIKSKESRQSSSNYFTDIYTWDDGIIKVENPYKNITFYIQDKTIKSTHTNDDEWGLGNNIFSYNLSRQLITLEEDRHSNTNLISFTWEGNKLLKIAENSYTTTVSYNNKKCTGYNPMIAFFIDEVCGLLFTHPELAGIRTNQLPDKVTLYGNNLKIIFEYIYSFYSDGYIKSCTENITTSYFSSTATNSNSYTFIWE